MVESKYLGKFTRDGAAIKLRGNRLLVELVPKEELKTKGGLVIAQSLSDHKSTTEMSRADVAIVLAVGEGYYDDESGADVSMDIKVGNVVLLSRFGLRTYSSFPGIQGMTPDTMALCRDNDVHAVWANIEEFDKYKQAMTDV